MRYCYCFKKGGENDASKLKIANWICKVYICKDLVEAPTLYLLQFGVCQIKSNIPLVPLISCSISPPPALPTNHT